MQKSNCLRNLFLALAFGCMLATVLSAGQCNRCMENNVACVNETHFKYCMNYNPMDDTTMNCGEGKICTSLAIICSNELPGVTPACQKSDVNCQSCDSDSLFVCTSRTTFRMCNDNAFTGETLTCPDETVCSIKSGKFCVKECELPEGKYDCDRAAP